MSKRTSIHARLIAYLLPFSAVAASLMSTAALGALSVTATANVDAVRQGELLNLEFTVVNTDAFARFGVVLTMAYPDGLSELFDSEFDGDCPSSTCSAGETVTWSPGTIPAGGATVVELPATVSAAAADDLLIPFNVVATDDLEDSDTASASVLVDGSTIYDLALAENGDPVIAGGMLTYKLTFGYREEAAAASNSRLLFTLPAGVSFVSATEGGAVNGGNVEWALGVLNPGDAGIREVTVQVGAGLSAATVIEASAEVLANSSPSVRIGAEADTVVAANVPLGLYIETNPGHARLGELTNVQLTVTNNDPFTRFGVELEARFPQSLNQVFESQFDGDCPSTTCTAGERVNWSPGDILAGASVTVDLPPVVAGTAVDGTMINLFASARDDSGAQARQLDTIIVQNDTLYDLSLAEDADPVTAGSLINYQLRYSYRADAAVVADSALHFTMPIGTSFVSVNGGGVLNGDVVEWPLGLLSPGDGSLRTVTVQADAGLANGTVLEATAELFRVADPVESARAEANTVAAASLPLSLEILTNRNTVEANARLSLRLRVTNNDPFTRFGVLLNVRYPRFLNQLFESDPNFMGDCNSTTCTAGERVSWPLVDIPAGGSVTMELPPSVSNTVIDGLLINFFATVRDDLNAQARNIRSVRVGTLAGIDTDGDGMSDNFEYENMLDPSDPGDADDDPDNDGLTNLEEFNKNLNLDPNDPDSDGDRIGDALDTDPINPSNECTGGDSDNATWQASVGSHTDVSCLARESINVIYLETFGVLSHLRLFAPTVIFHSDVRVSPPNNRLTVITSDPCPGCSSE